METPEKWMQYCLQLAQKAFDADEVPVGAVVVRGEELIAEAYNLRETQQSVLAHAEVLAVQTACEKLGSWRLTDCTLYTSLEPCVMCAGAIIQARVGKLIYGAEDPKGGAQSVFKLLESSRHTHHLEYQAGVCADESSALLKKFFTNKR